MLSHRSVASSLLDPLCLQKMVDGLFYLRLFNHLHRSTIENMISIFNIYSGDLLLDSELCTRWGKLMGWGGWGGGGGGWDLCSDLPWALVCEGFECLNLLMTPFAIPSTADSCRPMHADEIFKAPQHFFF